MDDLRVWLNGRYRNAEKLRPRFATATPFPHIVLRGFFREEKIAPVERALRLQPFTRTAADLYQFSRTPDFQRLSDRALRAFHSLFRSPAFINHIGTMTAVPLSGTIDMAGFLYQDTDYLLPHDDRLHGRAIAYILNLSKGFTTKDGGQLQLFATKHDKPARVVKTIPPTPNTLVLFKVTPRSFHQVAEVLSRKKRFSIAGWFHG